MRINGIWYNFDLTWDIERITNRCELDCCLQSDEEFIDHDTDCNWKEECLESFDIEIITQILNKLYVIDDFRRELQWHCKERSDLTDYDCKKYCQTLGLDFDKEYFDALEKVRLERELDEYIVTNQNGTYEIVIPEEQKETLEWRCESVGLNFAQECKKALKRKSFREKLFNYCSKGDTKDELLQFLQQECDLLGLKWDQEVTYVNNKIRLEDENNISETMENMASNVTARDTRRLAAELKKYIKARWIDRMK